ncbi:MAG: cytochrome c [Anaerolineae bacterium]|nr:cytochrome c [Anaerolineae bacterium]
MATIAPQPTRAAIVVANPEDLGEAVFAQRCTACHGDSGRGDGATARDAGITPPDFTLRETTAAQSLLQWTNTIRYGRIDNLMPPWQNSLSDEEIQAVAAYTFTLWQTAPEDSTPENSVEAPPISEAMGVVYGEVVVGSAGATVPDVISVALHTLDGEMNEVGFEMQILEGDIDYQFDDILIRSDYTYLLTAIQDDVVFYSETTFGTPQNPAIELPIFIYEVTNDPAVIEIDLLVMRLIPDNEEIIVQQVVNFINTSDYVYRGSSQIWMVLYSYDLGTAFPYR